MSDTIQVSAPTELEHDMRMPYEWLTKTASAILSASDLRREKAHLVSTNEHLTDTVSILEEKRDNLEKTLGDTATRLREALAREQELISKLHEKEREVTDLGNKLSQVTADRDDTEKALRQTEASLGRLQDEHLALGEAFGEASDKLEQFRKILGLPNNHTHTQPEAAPPQVHEEPAPVTSDPAPKAEEVSEPIWPEPKPNEGVPEVAPTHAEPAHVEAVPPQDAEVKHTQAFWDYATR